MPDPRPLPDAQVAAIAWADESVSNVELARALGLPRARVWAARRRIRQAGHWSCPLIWRTCPECGKPLASGPKPHRRTMHPACAKQRAAASTQASADNWRQANPERYRAIRERVQAR